MMDFEHAQIQAFSDRFSRDKITLCLFHLSQSLFLHLVDLGFKVRYQNDFEFSLQVRCLFALAFLPITDVISGFEDLVDSRSNVLPDQLMSYFEGT